MNRRATGTYESTSVAGEVVKAFVPRPLPPRPALELDGDVRENLDRALLALGRLDGISDLLPSTHLFLYAYVRKEAVLSSQNRRDAVHPVRPAPIARQRARVVRTRFPLQLHRSPA